MAGAIAVGGRMMGDSTVKVAKAREGNAWTPGLACESCGLAVRPRMVIHNCPQIENLPQDCNFHAKSAQSASSADIL